MRGAADRCMNIGLCRKSTTGAMCPSYIATREEEHATRGRANALVKALSEPIRRRRSANERLHEILDLCLMCKACKAECPLGVDMAKLKSETLSHYHDVHGVPLRSRVFGAIRTLNRLGSATAPLSNLPGAVTLAAQAAGASASASPRSGRLPRFERQNLVRWFRRRPATGRRRRGATQGTVNFLADSFTSFTEPHIGRAAIGLLEAAGWDVELVEQRLLRPLGAVQGPGRRRRDEARALVTALAQQHRQPDSPIVGCEPSCLFTLRDEHVTMLPGRPATSARSPRGVRQVEELLSEAIDDGRLVLAADSWLAGRRVLYHGHCHQKAEVGTAATVALLRRIPGIELVELDAGCCGMAGSFGYEAEHYDDLDDGRAGPALPGHRGRGRRTRSSRPPARRAASRSATARAGDAWHPIELVAQALVPATAGQRGPPPEAPPERSPSAEPCGPRPALRGGWSGPGSGSGRRCSRRSDRGNRPRAAGRPSAAGSIGTNTSPSCRARRAGVSSPVGTDEQPARVAAPARSRPGPGPAARVGDVVQHREARGRGEPARRQRERGRVGGDHLDRPTGQPAAQGGGELLVDLDGGDPGSQLHQQVGDQARDRPRAPARRRPARRSPRTQGSSSSRTSAAHSALAHSRRCSAFTSSPPRPPHRRLAGERLHGVAEVLAAEHPRHDVVAVRQPGAAEPDGGLLRRPHGQRRVPEQRGHQCRQGLLERRRRRTAR